MKESEKTIERIAEKSMKIVWVLVVIVAIIALAWFMYEAWFTYRLLGGIGYFIFIFIWIPTLIFVLGSILLLIMNKIPKNFGTQVVVILILITFVFFFPGTLFFAHDNYENMHQQIMAQNRISSEKNQRITSDGRFRYELFLSGTLTDSPRAHVSIRDVATGERVGSVVLDIRMEDIRPHEELILIPKALLIELTPTDIEYVYILTTTTYLKEEIEVFEIDIIAGTSRRIE
jgi:hypothetical protein